MTPRAARRVLAGAASLLALAGLAGGLPVALYVLGGGSPLPRTVPSWHHVLATLLQPDHGQVFLATVRWAGWAGWAVFTLSVLLEGISVARGSATPRLAAVSPLQGLAAALVGTAVMGLLPGLHAPRTATLPARPAQAAATAPPAPTWRPAPPPPAQPAAGATASAAAAAMPARAGTYRVVAGDSLWGIAARHLGDGGHWHEIYALNRGRPQPGGGALTDPDLIQPGWRLRLPHPPSRTPPPATAPARPFPHPRNGQAHSHPAPAPHAAPRPAPTAAHHAHHSRPSVSPVLVRRQRPAGVHLPEGGVVGITLAAAVSAALVAWRVRRRSLPRAGPPGGWAEPAWPAAVQTARRAHMRSLAADKAEADGELWPDDAGATQDWLDSLREDGDSLYEDDLDDGGADFPLPAPPWFAAMDGTAAPGMAEWWPPPPPGRPQQAGTVAFAARGGREVPFSDLPGGAGLTGPGAEAVARSLLVGVLAAAGGAEVVVSEPCLARLTGHPHVVPGVTPGFPDGLTVTATLADALSHLEVLTTRRTRLLDEAPPGRELPPLVLFATPEPATPARLRAVIEAGDAVGLATVIVGADHPTGVTCRVGGDGTVLAATDPALAGAEAFHLPAASAAAMLTLLRGSQGHLTSPQPAAGSPARDTAPSGPPPASGHAPSGTGASAVPVPAHVNGNHRQPPGTPAGPPPAGGSGAPADAVAADGAVRPVQLRVLGPVQIQAGGSVVQGGLRKARELLAYLALHPDGVSAETAAEALWPGSDPRYSTRQRALALRRARDLLRTHTGRAAPMFIFLADDRFRLDPSLIAVDLWDFHAALDRARHATATQEQVAALAEAAGLYRGPLADGAGYEWTEPPAEEARLRAAEALTRLGELLAPADPDRALENLDKAMDHDRHNEAVFLAAIRVQHQLARPDAVRRTLDRLRANLAGIGLTPSPETLRAAALLTTSPPPPPPPPAG